MKNRINVFLLLAVLAQASCLLASERDYFLSPSLSRSVLESETNDSEEFQFVSYNTTMDHALDYRLQEQENYEQSLTSSLERNQKEEHESVAAFIERDTGNYGSDSGLPHVTDAQLNLPDPAWYVAEELYQIHKAEQHNDALAQAEVEALIRGTQSNAEKSVKRKRAKPRIGQRKLKKGKQVQPDAVLVVDEVLRPESEAPKVRRKTIRKPNKPCQGYVCPHCEAWVPGRSSTIVNKHYENECSKKSDAALVADENTVAKYTKYLESESPEAS